MDTEVFGALDGQTVDAVTLSNGGVRARLITFGARLTELWVPDADGQLADIVLGFDDLDSYLDTGGFFGATCGQYANRIAAGRCVLDGHPVQLDMNEGGNHLHGGRAGFDRKIWRIDALSDHSVTFAAVSEEGEMGFPGRSAIWVRYTLEVDGALEIEMTADTDKVTLMNMVNHSYFNLAGQGSGDVLDHELQIFAAFYTPVDADLLATGDIRGVRGTPFDFRKPKPIGQDIAAVFAGPEGGRGYDHNWCLDAGGVGMRPCAMARDPGSGRVMQLATSEPGVQLYIAGHLGPEVAGKRGKNLRKFAGFTLETQKFPGTPTFAHFPDCTLSPGDIYRHRMVLSFGADVPGR